MRRESDYFTEIDERVKTISDRLTVLDVKSEIGMERFVRSFSLDDLISVFPYSSLIFEGFDVNWYEEGNYQTGLLRINLFRYLEKLFREANLLNDDER